MAEKKSHTWNEIQTIIMFFAMSVLFALWNVFATFDRQRVDCKVRIESIATLTANSMVEEKTLAAVQSYGPNVKCITGTGAS